MPQLYEKNIQQGDGTQINSIAMLEKRINLAEKLMKYHAYWTFTTWLAEIGAFNGRDMFESIGQPVAEYVNIYLTVGENNTLSIDLESSAYYMEFYGLVSYMDFEDLVDWKQPSSKLLSLWNMYLELDCFYFALESVILPLAHRELWSVALPDGLQPHAHRTGRPIYVPYEPDGESEQDSQ